MNKIIGLIMIFFSTSVFAGHAWLTVYPKNVKLLGSGLLLQGQNEIENISLVTCATNKTSIYLKNSDEMFDQKLSMALSAQAQGKAIQTLIYSPDSNPDACTTVSAHGSVGTAYFYYWHLMGD
ncbi:MULTISPECIES: hypothetical protein [unclassified Oleiphilus]|uniref:hypothetical protein n=1 Tax=unclassified Oleiphilus TaxID=2631174 RepID=UPI0007C3FE4A|nr:MULTISPECIES: hypothetical protein [unclassified Oleiphilus]KZZ35853.1 hypothetical protein A3757_14790 [Oleiphilus sp. HI0117]KZZ51897.1 hypothetical protein A3761_19625 [Oleiphilus sp. HI0123]